MSCRSLYADISVNALLGDELHDCSICSLRVTSGDAVYQIQDIVETACRHLSQDLNSEVRYVNSLHGLDYVLVLRKTGQIKIEVIL